MNTSKIIAAAALSLLAVAGVAQAETYDGVLTVHSTLSRSEVASQGVVAARSENVAATAYGQGVQPQLLASAPRATIRAEAVAAAHDPLWNLDRKAFVNSTIPSQYKRTHMSFTRQAAL
ncbi:alpha/beta hydrolase [Variovorax sp. PAMC 28711]|uniref:alpha/beta hydrolase n=1 Tax=Variovorax sp. PAMC 28711 TaxID=1795631 RepID=UPI00078C520C|nr:alpha/beta hydrolase [Variovorax sp. PAMC 28711]AMM24479.1 alpha/beta hydrolase [Variovorax sp. PAMC 28711]